MLLSKEELWWKQRANEHWLKYSDRNTKYYHACANGKRKRNFVGEIYDDMGVKSATPVEVERAFVDYFHKLFSSEQVESLGLGLHLLEGWVDEGINEELTKPFTAAEIGEALHQMAPLKALGPDGLNTCFFQKNWGIMVDEVCCVVLDILNSGIMPSDLNRTHIALISKLEIQQVSWNSALLTYATSYIKLYQRSLPTD
jgi:hypothetical protein